MMPKAWGMGRESRSSASNAVTKEDHMIVSDDMGKRPDTVLQMGGLWFRHAG